MRARQDQVAPIEGGRGWCDAPGLTLVQVELESFVDYNSLASGSTVPSDQVSIRTNATSFFIRTIIPSFAVLTLILK